MKTEVELPNRPNFLILFLDEGEWKYAGQAATERSALTFVRELEQQGYKVKVEDYCGTLWHLSVGAY